MTRSPTERQRELLAAYLRTGSRKQAAAELGVSVGTARRMLGRLYASLGAVSANHAAMLIAADEYDALVAAVDGIEVPA